MRTRSTGGSRHPLLLIVLGTVMLSTLFTVFGQAGSAPAHDYLVSSTPRAGETLTALPTEFSITTNDALLNVDGTGAGFALQISDGAGRYYGDGCVTINGTRLSTPAALGAAGAYTVTWQAVSADGHTVSDSFGFTWRPPAGFAPSPGTTAAPDCQGRSIVNRSPAPGSLTAGAQTVGRGTLAVVLWVGGGILALAAAVIAALVFAGRKNRAR